MWSSSEFGFVELDDAFSTGSSLMPQKKNPTPRSSCAGNPAASSATWSAAGDAEGAPALVQSRHAGGQGAGDRRGGDRAACLDVLTGVIATLRVNAEATARAASDPMLIATDLADHLVLRGVPFREAHGIVGRVVAHALGEGVSLASLSRQALLAFHPALDVDPASFFSVERSLEARVAPGAPSRVRVHEAIASARADLAGESP